MSTPPEKHAPVDLAALREQFASLKGPRYWRSLEELAGTAEFQEYLRREFPPGAEVLAEPMSRRGFLKVMVASLALAGLTACAPPPNEQILPYAGQPDPALVPGKPLYFATAMPLNGFGLGILVESHLGRPTKVEGNPDHPASRGATDAFAQASVLSLYDPDRAQAVMHLGEISTWEAFVLEARAVLQAASENRGAGVRLLTEAISSPTLGAQIRSMLDGLPGACWTVHEPVGDDNARAGARLAFGQDTQPVFHFDVADRVLALDADFLHTFPGRVRYAREFGERRRVAGNASPATMSRMYAVESSPTVTGASADHRLPMRASQIEAFARVVAQRLGLDTGPVDEAPFSPDQILWAEAVARDMRDHPGTSLVVAGHAQPPAVHALGHAMNEALGAIGRTVTLIPPVVIDPGDRALSLADLTAEMRAGTVEALFVLGSNPVFTAPSDLDFAAALERVPFRAHLGLYPDETAALCHWSVPETHFLEAWSDVRAHDGTATIMQPLIAPLYGGRSAHEFLGALLGDMRSGYDILRAHWQGQAAGQDFERYWRRAVHDGVVEGTAFPALEVRLAADFRSLRDFGSLRAAEAMELVFRPDPTVWDGRFANNAWLQELPKPLTTLTWDNPALIAPATAARLGLADGDMVELDHHGRALRAAVHVAPGQAEDSVTLYLGYGRTRVGRVGEGLGFNAYSLRTTEAQWFGAGLRMQKAEGSYPLATTQEHYSLENRDLFRAGTLEQYRARPDFAQTEFDRHEPPPSLYPEWEYPGYAWGMAIDLSACIGCNACVAACVAENNIPVVGKEGVLRSREMHWLKVDQYYEGSPETPAAYFQPRPCMHCEKAPCEPVCPVEATVHDSEGLNQMIYNRCVGTRFCSNNCPYKVRRFNFFDYTEDVPSLNLLRNPDVTVRARGVMEKCTYCVQRIEAARIEAETEDRRIRDGEVRTACQQACPTQAIVFGDIHDRTSRVAHLKTTPLNYGMLAELGTQPRTTYLAKVRNANQEIGD